MTPWKSSLGCGTFWVRAVDHALCIRVLKDCFEEEVGGGFRGVEGERVMVSRRYHDTYIRSRAIRIREQMKTRRTPGSDIVVNVES